MTWKRAIAVSALTLAVVCGLASFYVREPSRTELESTDAFWQDDSNFWQGHKGRRTATHSHQAAHNTHHKLLVKGKSRHAQQAAHQHQKQLHQLAAKTHASKPAAKAATSAAPVDTMNKVPLATGKAFEKTFDKAYKKAYSLALAKEEATLEAEATAGEDAEKQLDDLKKKAKLRNLELQPQPEPEPVKVPEEEEEEPLEEQVQEEQKVVEEEKEEVVEDKKAEKKRKDWDAVAFGAKKHMHEGPYYREGEEHYAPFKHCELGGCEPLEHKGVNVDSWSGLEGASLPRTLPLPGWDPSADIVAMRAQTQRKGRWAKFNTGTNAAEWGKTDPLHDPTAERLEKHGVNVQGTSYKALPLPNFDETEFDHTENESRNVAVSAEEALQRNRDQDSKLESKGVNVNELPSLSASGFTHMDGISDKLIKVVGVPDYRKDGVADFEKPSSFLLRDEKYEERGAAQPQRNKHGYEDPETQTQEHSHLSKAGVNVNAWPDKLGDIFD